MKRSILITTSSLALIAIAFLATDSSLRAAEPSHVMKSRYRIEVKDKMHDTWRFHQIHDLHDQAYRIREALLLSKRYAEVRVVCMPCQPCYESYCSPCPTPCFSYGCWVPSFCYPPCYHHEPPYRFHPLTMHPPIRPLYEGSRPPARPVHSTKK